MLLFLFTKLLKSLAIISVVKINIFIDLSTTTLLLTLLDLQKLQPGRGFAVVPFILQTGTHKLIYAQLQSLNVLHIGRFFHVFSQILFSGIL